MERRSRSDRFRDWCYERRDAPTCVMSAFTYFATPSVLTWRCEGRPRGQALAGHQEIGTTQRYMHLSPAAIEGAIRLLDERGAAPQNGNIVATAAATSENVNRPK